MDTTNPAPDVATRRAFLRGAGLTLGAASLSVPVLAGVAGTAGAQQDTDTTAAGGTDTTAGAGTDTTAGAGTDTTAGAGTDTTAAGGADTTAAGGGDTTAPAATSTTTTLPRRPEPDDIEVLAFAQSLELAAVAAYGQIVDSGVLDEEVSKIARLFQRHHQDHGDAFAGLAGSGAPNQANTAYLDELSGLVEQASDQNATLEVAITIENRAAAFYVGALDSIVALEPAALIASIAPIDGRHAVVLAEAIGLDLDDYLPAVLSAAEAPTPTDYPLDQD